MAEVSQILCPKCRGPNVRRARFCQHCGHDVVLNNEAPSDERRYVITRVIKQGGQGAIFEGIDDSGRVYAIKEMRDRFTDPRERVEAIEHFNAEAEVLQRLSHPRIPRVYSHFRDEGSHYLTMDFIHGEDLEELAEREGPIDEARVIEWGDQICDVLAYLHGQGLIYRDMKPANVMIDQESGGVKLIDFGITTLFKPAERGSQIGTPGYAAPEQYQGLATPQSDIYALGATLHRLLTGRDPTDKLPFSAPRADSIPGAQVSRGTADALEKALQKVPQDRFATMDDFWAALRPERRSDAAGARPQQTQVRVAPPVRAPQPAAAQVRAPQAMAPAAPPGPSAPAPGARRPQGGPEQPAAPQRPAPPRVRPRRSIGARVAAFVGGLMRTMLTLMIVAAMGLGAYVYFERPAWAEPYVGPILEVIPTGLPGMPTAAPTAPAIPPGPHTYEVQATVPTGSDLASIRQALIEAFEAQAQAAYGPAAQVNMNRPPRYVDGEPTLMANDGSVSTYAARLEGYLFAGE